MDCSLSYNTLSFSRLQFLPFAVKTTSSSLSSSCSRLGFSFGNYGLGFSFSVRSNRRRALVVVAASSGSQCGEYSGLNTPLEPRSAAGLFLTSVLLDDREYFLDVAKKQLEQLADDRSEAVARMNLSFGSDEAFLHRRIAEWKEHECQTAVQDVMYMLICYRFYGISVHMVPQLSKCIYNGRLEISPSKDWELESIHSFEVLEMIRDHLTALVGWKANSNVTFKWETTQVSRLQLCRVYTASILYGYLIKSASLRLSLEKGLSAINFDVGTRRHFPMSEMCSLGSKDVVFGRSMSTQSTSAGEVSHSHGKNKKQENLKCYLMGFDSEVLQMCAKPKSKEAARLIEMHASALFGDDKTGLLDSNDIISTSYASLKRFVLEAIAFGSFLWDAEEYVKAIYELEEN